MSLLRIMITKNSILLVGLLITWCSPVLSFQSLLASSMSEGPGKEDHAEGFQVWLSEYLQISVELLTEMDPSKDKENRLGICIHSNRESSPVHVAIAIETRLLNNKRKSVSKYSFEMEGRGGWRNSSDFFDFLIHSSQSCDDKNKLEFGYKVDMTGRKQLASPDFMDTITLTVRPE